ncbi:hypothetical protein LX32DRAFT_646842 [Colletotrichum zoysiae]|uniref:Uncharacterized protein n=1 Tax=Colletotrichum zoysiae TaxID=1216348 RepID=A0AAD9H3A3_9PEZI|nr:hypothetical protein LX32DRAFT_646842 [Colletotrichum zoysiae]
MHQGNDQASVACLTCRRCLLACLLAFFFGNRALGQIRPGRTRLNSERRSTPTPPPPPPTTTTTTAVPGSTARQAADRYDVG